MTHSRIRRAHAVPTAAREVRARMPALPPSLAARLDGYACWRNRVAASDAAVYRLCRPGAPDLYLKTGHGRAAQALMDEYARVAWSSGRLPVARVVHVERTGHRAWLLSQALAGRTAYEWAVDAPDRMPRIVAALAGFLRRLHALPAHLCPFQAHHLLRLAQARQRLDDGLIDAEDFDPSRHGWTPHEVWQELQEMLPLRADRVVTHGDFSLDNIVLDARCEVVGVVDLGRLGVADRYQDLSILWNNLSEFGEPAQRLFLARYGIRRPNRRKLAFHLCLDECF